MLEIATIPEEVRDNFIRRKISKGQILSYGKNGKIGYMLNGDIQTVRYQEGERFIFPELLERGKFLGISYFLLNVEFEFELETREDCVVLEIPVEIFKRYILSEPAVEIRFLKEASFQLLHSTRSFFIRANGGTKAYAAYLIYIFSERENVIKFKGNTEIEEVVFSSRTMIYKTIKEFEDRGILKKEARCFIVKNRELLREYFGKYVN